MGGQLKWNPVEWNIGEAAGCLAAYCVEKNLSPRSVREQPDHLADFQRFIQQQGIEIRWADAARSSFIHPLRHRKLPVLVCPSRYTIDVGVYGHPGRTGFEDRRLH